MFLTIRQIWNNIINNNNDNKLNGVIPKGAVVNIMFVKCEPYKAMVDTWLLSWA